jgi:acyl-CoA synthetase (AMP-forming)/AMP-acid ligase II
MGADGWLRRRPGASTPRAIFIVDRKKEMLVSGGFNVARGRVVLAQHPAV